MTVGVFAGTFDPITYGHTSIIHRALKFCDHLVIAIGINSAKKPLFSLEERISFIKDETYVFNSNISVQTFDGLLVDFVEGLKAVRTPGKILIRGVRSVADFDYEANLANINQKLNPMIETVLLVSDPEVAIVSSSMVKEIARFGHDVRKFVPPTVSEALIKKNI